MKRLNKKILPIVALSTLSLATNTVFGANEAATASHKRPKGSYSVTDALANGQTHFQLRLRDEYAHNDDYLQGNAITLRSLLGYESASALGFRAALEINAVSTLDADRFNSGADPNKYQYTMILDPKGAELTNGYLAYDRFPETDIIVGRQYIDLDNQRFFGRNDFRQTPKTFDAITIKNKSTPVELFYGYVRQYNTVLNDNKLEEYREDKLNTHLFNVAWNCADIGRLVGYAYLVNDKDVGYASTNTYGGRFDGKVDVNEIKVEYGMEYAHQTSEHNNPLHYDVDYAQAEVKLNAKPYYTRFAYELLGGDGSDTLAAFQTPYASNHNFLGDADVFLITPDIGIQDFSITAGGSMSEYDVHATYHNFQSDHRNVDFGYEYDLAVQRNFGEHYYASVAFADFHSHDQTPFEYADTEKWWLTAGVTF